MEYQVGCIFTTTPEKSWVKARKFTLINAIHYLASKMHDEMLNCYDGETRLQIMSTSDQLSNTSGPCTFDSVNGRIYWIAKAQ